MHNFILEDLQSENIIEYFLMKDLLASMRPSSLILLMKVSRLCDDAAFSILAERNVSGGVSSFSPRCFVWGLFFFTFFFLS